MARNIFENQISGILVLLDDIVNYSDIWVIQRGQKFGLTLETHPGIRVACQFSGHALDGHGAVELGVVSQIDYSHASSANHLYYFKATDFLANKMASGHYVFKVVFICPGK